MVHIFLILSFDSNLTQQLLIYCIGWWRIHYTVTGNKYIIRTSKQVITTHYICPTGSQSYLWYYVNTNYYIYVSRLNQTVLELYFCILPLTGFELTPLIHCSTNRFALCPAPYTTRPHPLHKNGASIVEVLPCPIRKI
jgi:hypothetical protein